MLEKVESVSRTISIAAIPLVLAVGGWILQRHLQNQSIGATYVNLAVTILENPDKLKVPLSNRLGLAEGGKFAGPVKSTLEQIGVTF
jgi:hypothetical protein